MKRILILLIILITSCTPVEPQTTEPRASASPISSTATLTDEPTTIPPLHIPTSTPVETDRWWDETVFYEIFVRSFYDSDGDGVGDINGLIEKLDYLNDGDPDTDRDLGITGIWLMPVTESPSYHGYDVVDYYTIDQEYGTEKDFHNLIDEAHNRGIRVIVDLVLNHTSRQHPWFLDSEDDESEHRDWYLWESEKPGYRGPWNQDVWHKLGDEYFYGVFWSGMPDLNLQNPAVTKELFDITSFWLKDMKVDGFRLDAVKHLVENGFYQENTNETHAWLEEFYKFYKKTDPTAITVGEAWTTTTEVLDYSGDEVDIAFAFDLAQAIIKTVRGPLPSPIISEMTKMVENFPSGQYATFLSNHDQNRVMSQLRGDVGRAKIAATILLTSPGVPFIYYGEEIGMSGVKPDEDIRLPMQWSAENTSAGMSTSTPWRMPAADYSEINLVDQVDDPDSLFSQYRSLIHLRNQHTALQIGEWKLVDPGSQWLYAFIRHQRDEVFLILLNVHTRDLTVESYGLTLETGPLSEPVEAYSLLGLKKPASPMVNKHGGFSKYIPFESLPPKSFAVIQFSK